jgi:hypothetical protein
MTNDSFLHSSLREKVLEHLFVGDLLRCLWRLGRRDIEVLRAEVDYAGYDLVVECNAFVRHVQLKSSHRNSTAKAVNVHIGLAQKPSACIVWIRFDSDTMELGPFLWFGAEPGQPVSALGHRVARHTRADHSGIKGFRPNLRVISKSNFRELFSIEQVAVGTEVNAPV